VSPEEFTTALQTLGLDTQAAAKWLGVSVRAVQRYRVSGVKGPVERALKAHYALIAARNEIVWWAEEHGCCDGHQDETLNIISLALDWRE